MGLLDWLCVMLEWLMLCWLLNFKKRDYFWCRCIMMLILEILVFVGVFGSWMILSCFVGVLVSMWLFF